SPFVKQTSPRAEPGRCRARRVAGLDSEIVARGDILAKDIPRRIDVRGADDHRRVLGRVGALRRLAIGRLQEEPDGSVEGELRDTDETEGNLGTCARTYLKDEPAGVDVGHRCKLAGRSATEAYIELRCNLKIEVARAAKSQRHAAVDDERRARGVIGRRI